MRKLLLGLVLAAALVAPLVPGTASAATDGTISGKLINGTAGGTIPATQEVTLKVYANGQQTATPLKTTSDAGGNYQFTGLDTGANYSYEVDLIYLDVEYTSDPIAFASGETAKTSDTTIYETTTSQDNLSVTITHMVAYPEENGVRIVEYSVFQNDGDRAIVGVGPADANGKKNMLEFFVPPTATELQYGGKLMTCCVVPTDSGFADTMGVLPGATMTSFSYLMVQKAGTYDFTRPTRYATGTFYFLVQDAGGIKVSSAQLTQGETLNVEDASFVTYSTQNVPAGTVIEARITGLKRSNSQSILKWAGIVIILAAAGAGLAYMKWGRRRHALVPAAAGAGTGAEQAHRKLLVEIARLDDDFEDGKISAEEHERQRSLKKQQIKDLLNRSRSEGNAGPER